MTLSVCSGLTNFPFLVYCEIIINRGVLIVVNQKNLKILTKYNFPIECCLLCLKPLIQEPVDQCFWYKPRKFVSVNKNTFTIFKFYFLILFAIIILCCNNCLMFFLCNFFIFPRTYLYIHDSINTMFQCTKVTM